MPRSRQTPQRLSGGPARSGRGSAAAAVQAGYVNFYADDGVNPYIALGRPRPWVVTLKGAVLHDSGGYGMLGFGHTPKAVIDAMASPRRWPTS
jgi:hypothetical protein